MANSRINKTNHLHTTYKMHKQVDFTEIVKNSIGGEMVSMLASSVVDCGFDPLLCQTTDY